MNHDDANYRLKWYWIQHLGTAMLNWLNVFHFTQNPSIYIFISVYKWSPVGLMFVSQMTISSYRRKRRTLYLFFDGWRRNSNLCINCGRLCLDVIYQAWDVVFHHQTRISRCFVWWWNTVSNAWYYFSNKMIFEGEIKDAKLSSFSSDFQTLIKH